MLATIHIVLALVLKLVKIGSAPHGCGLVGRVNVLFQVGRAQPPPELAVAGEKAASLVQRRAVGQPSPNGRYPGTRKGLP